jgi:hypothetical protein
MSSLSFEYAAFCRRLWATVGVTLIVTFVWSRIALPPAPPRIDGSRRYTSDFGGVADGDQDDRGKPLTPKVAALPGVESVESASFVFGGLGDVGDWLDALVFAGRTAPGAVGGRSAASPTGEHEFVAARKFARTDHMQIGDKVNLVTMTPEQANRTATLIRKARVCRSRWSAFDGASQLDDEFRSSSCRPLCSPRTSASTLMNVDLRPGVDLTEFRSARHCSGCCAESRTRRADQRSRSQCRGCPVQGPVDLRGCRHRRSLPCSVRC